MLKIVGTVFLLLIVSQQSFATVGCLVGTRLHTNTNNGSTGGIPSYDDSPSIDATTFCIRRGTVSTPCQIKFWFLIWIATANGQQGDYGTGAPIYCPIDSYAGLMLIPLSLVGLLFIRKKYSLKINDGYSLSLSC